MQQQLVSRQLPGIIPYRGCYEEARDELRRHESNGIEIWPEKRFYVLDMWLMDGQNDMCRPGPRTFFDKMGPILPNDVLPRVLAVTLEVLVTDQQAPVQRLLRLLRHLQNPPYNMPMQWHHEQHSNYLNTHEKRPWEVIYRWQRHRQSSRRQLIEHLVLLRDETFFLQDVLDKLEQRKNWFEEQQRIWGANFARHRIPPTLLGARLDRAWPA